VRSESTGEILKRRRKSFHLIFKMPQRLRKVTDKVHLLDYRIHAT